MTLPNIINTIGVTLILLAFFLHTINKLTQADKAYHILNLVGAGLACYGSYLIKAWPFVALEGIWALVAAYALIKKRKF